MDIGTISLILLVGLLVLLAIGMPLGLASAVMAVAVLVMKFEPALISDPLSFGDGFHKNFDLHLHGIVESDY